MSYARMSYGEGIVVYILYNNEVTLTWSVSKITLGKIPKRTIGIIKEISNINSLLVKSLVTVK